MGQPQIISGFVLLKVVCGFRFEEWVVDVQLNVSIDENTECLCFLNSLMLELSELWGRCSTFPVWPCNLESFSDFRWLILMVCLVLFWTARLLKINLTPVSWFLLCSLFIWILEALWAIYQGMCRHYNTTIVQLGS